MNRELQQKKVGRYIYIYTVYICRLEIKFAYILYSRTCLITLDVVMEPKCAVC